MSSDLIQAVLLDDRVVSVGVRNGKIASITPCAPGTKAQSVILPRVIDPHVHLDKAFTIDRCTVAEPGLFGAIDAMHADKPRWTEDDLRDRMTCALTEAYDNGVSALRSHVDWELTGAPLAWHILGELAQDWRGRVHLQRATLSLLDWVDDTALADQTAQLAAKSGDALGYFVYRNDNLRARLEQVFTLAAKYDVALDFHVDEGLDPEARGFDDIVDLTQRYGMAGRVLCGHACALSVRDAEDLKSVADQAAKAGVILTVLPTTNLHLQDMTPGRAPRLRGLAPMQELAAAGVQIAIGCDNVRDPFYPYGSHDPIEALRLGCLVGHLDPSDWHGAITDVPATALGLTPPRIAVGEPADFITLEGANWTEAMRSGRVARTLRRSTDAIPKTEVFA